MTVGSCTQARNSIRGGSTVGHANVGFRLGFCRGRIESLQLQSSGGFLANELTSVSSNREAVNMASRLPVTSKPTSRPLAIAPGPGDPLNPNKSSHSRPDGIVCSLHKTFQSREAKTTRCDFSPEITRSQFVLAGRGKRDSADSDRRRSASALFCRCRLRIPRRSKAPTSSTELSAGGMSG